MSKEDKMMDAAFEIYMKNPVWKKRYEDAPTEACREYLKYVFYSSQYYDPDAEDAEKFEKKQEEAESKLKLGDWIFLRDMLPSSPFAGYCNQKIRQFQE